MQRTHAPVGDDACCLYVFCPAREDVQERSDTVRIVACTSAAEASCPECGLSSARVCGRPLVIELEVRRFLCGATVCEREIFAERLDLACPDMATLQPISRPAQGSPYVQ